MFVVISFYNGSEEEFELEIVKTFEELKEAKKYTLTCLIKDLGKYADEENIKAIKDELDFDNEEYKPVKSGDGYDCVGYCIRKI